MNSLIGKLVTARPGWVTKKGHLKPIHQTYFGFVDRKTRKKKRCLEVSVSNCNSGFSGYLLIWRLLKTIWQPTRGDGVPWIRHFSDFAATLWEFGHNHLCLYYPCDSSFVRNIFCFRVFPKLMKFWIESENYNYLLDIGVLHRCCDLYFIIAISILARHE